MIKTIFIALKQVFSNRRYLVIAILSATAVFTIMVLLPNWRLVAVIAGVSSIHWLDRFFIILKIVGSAANIFGMYYSLYIVLVSILFGINTALFFYYFAWQKSLPRKSGIAASVSGLASGILGVGCTACGSIALSPLLVFFGASGAVAFLPFGGKEFSILGVILLALSIFFIARKIVQPATCPSV